MSDEHKPLPDSPAQPEPDSPPPAPQRPSYTPAQRLLALLGAIVVAVITLMYTYSIATGDLFFR